MDFRKFRHLRAALIGTPLACIAVFGPLSVYAQEQEVWNYCWAHGPDSGSVYMSGLYIETPGRVDAIEAAAAKSGTVSWSGRFNCADYSHGPSREQAERNREKFIANSDSRVIYVNFPELAWLERSVPPAGSRQSAYGSTADPAAVAAEVARLGEHRRAEAERLVALREAATRSRGQQSPASGATTAQTTGRSTRANQAYVRPPPLPETVAPKGFFDRSLFVNVTNLAETRLKFEESYGSCGGRAEYVVEACYPDGIGGHNCQARVRCPLTVNQRGTQK